jgi:aldose 1-epimerase
MVPAAVRRFRCATIRAGRPLFMCDTATSFGRLPDGTDVGLFVLRNDNAVEVRVIAYGAIVVSIRTPDRQGESADIVLGCDDLAGYLTPTPYFGAVVGRYGNRIARGRFTLDGATYQLAVNNGVNHLHGGIRGFDKVVWQVSASTPQRDNAVVFTYTSADGEEGYPGMLQASVTYTLTANNELAIEYQATADKPTPVNLTNHSYFNLAGDGRGDILQHLLTIDADRFTPVDDTMIPTGTLAPVEGTPFDFRRETAIGARIDSADEQIRRGLGYDHNFVVRGAPGLRRAARLVEPRRGRTLDVATTEPGLQFYSGNLLAGEPGKAGRRYEKRTGLCLETQHFPDSPNHPEFPSTILRPGDTYRSKTVFAFGTAP